MFFTNKRLSRIAAKRPKLVAAIRFRAMLYGKTPVRDFEDGVRATSVDRGMYEDHGAEIGLEGSGRE